MTPSPAHRDEQDATVTDTAPGATAAPEAPEAPEAPAGAGSGRPSALVTVLATALMPLFFMTLLTTTLVSASHAPRPNDLDLVLVGPSETTSQLQQALDEQAPGSFRVATTTDADQARRDIEQREAVGAVVVGDDGTVTVLEATAGGSLAAGAVREVGDSVAAELGTTSTTEDLAPLADRDATGTTLFFLFIACTVGAFLAIVGPSQVRPRLSTRELLTSTAVATVAIPLVAYGIVSLFVGAFGQGPGPVAATLGVAALYTATVALLASFCHQLVGVGGVFLVMILAVGLNFPSSGGTAPESMLPSFWQGLHEVWFGAGGLEAMRSLLYFDGAGAAPFVAQLAVWTGVLLVLVLGTAFLRRHRPARPHSSLDQDLQGASGLVSA